MTTTSETGQRPNYGNPAVLARALNKQPTDPVITDLLEAATTKFISHLGRPLDYTEHDEIWLSGDGSPMLALPAAPIHGDPIINILGTPAPVPALPGSGRHGVQIGRRTGILWRPAGWPDGLENIHVTYSHGYQTIPSDVQDVVTEAAVMATHPVGVARVSTGDESIDFIRQIAESGTTAYWNHVVDAYRLTNNGDGK